jgi:hypothetical protein
LALDSKEVEHSAQGPEIEGSNPAQQQQEEKWDKIVVLI